MGKIRNRQEEAINYQDTLEKIKEEGIIDDKTTPESKKKGFGNLVNRSEKVNLPIIGDEFRAPMFKTEGKQFGKSEYDTAIDLPISFYDESSENQKNIFESEVKENRAQNQPATHKWLNGIGWFASTAGTEFGKGIGYVGGGIAALFTQDVDTVVNNAFVQAFDELDDAVKESIPIYKRREIENGTLARQLWSPEFWAMEGSEGAGFLVSSILSGGVVGGISKGLSISKNFANLAKVAKLTKDASKFADKTDEFVMTLTQSYIESMAETDGSIKEFDEYWGQFKQEDGSYNVDGKIISPEEVQILRGELGAQTFGLNMVATALPNYFTTKAIFGKSSTRSVLDELGLKTTSIPAMKEGLQNALKRTDLVKDIVTEGAKGTGLEAFQELSQFAIQDYGEAKSRMKTDDDLFEGLLKGYMEGFTSIEGQKSMILGGVLGLGPGLRKGYKERKSRLERASSLVKMMDENISGLRDDFESYYVKDEEGNLKKDENDKFIINVNKINEDLQDAENEINDNTILSYYKSQGMTHAAKTLTVKKLLEKALPYFQEEGGEAIFMEQLSELTEVMENDGQSLGFKGKEDYLTFLNESVTEAKREYDNIRGNGPRFFEINLPEMYENSDKKASTKKALDNFYTQLEYQGTLLGSMININSKELNNINAEYLKFISDITTAYNTNNPNVKGEIKSIEEMIDVSPDNFKLYRDYKLLESKKKALEKSIKDLNKAYKSIFDKNEQTKAFQSFIDKEKSKEAVQKEFEEAVNEEKSFADEFYKNLESKGYTDIQDSFNNNRVKLQNEKGDIYSIQKEFDPKSQKSQFYVVPVNEIGTPISSKKELLSKEKMESLGISKLENIMSPNEFKSWKKRQKVIIMNDIRLKKLEELMANYTRKKLNVNEQIDSKIRELEEIQNEVNLIESWIKSNEFSYSEAIDSLVELDSKRQSIELTIEDLNQTLVNLKDSQSVLFNLRREIVTLTEQGEEFSFSLKLQQLKDDFNKNQFIEDEELINLTIDDIESQITDFETMRDNIIDFMDDLSQAIVENKSFEEIINTINEEGKGTLKPLIDWLNDNLPGVYDNETERIDYKSLKKAILNSEKRSALLSHLKDKRAELWKSYNIEKGNLKVANDSLNGLKKQLGKLLANKVILKRNQFIEANIKHIITNNKIAERLSFEKDLSKNQYNQGSNPLKRVEQDGDTSKEDTFIKKRTPFTTISNIYENKENTIIHTNPEKLAQSSNWAKAMMSININELDRYQARIVDNNQLSNEGIIPPVEDSSALYTILYKDGSPYIGDNGIPVFTGIANTSTYFKDDGTSTIDVTDDYRYLNALNQNNKQPIDFENPFIINDMTFYSLSELENHLINELKEKYHFWRNDLWNKVNEGQQVYKPITDISKGFPIRYSSEKNNPKQVFNINKLHVGRNFIKKSNGVKEFVSEGKIYAELENGQVQRLLNKTISTLPEDKKGEKLNTIIKFMSLANSIDNKDYNKGFRFKQSASEKNKNYTPERIPLFGNGTSKGILDYHIAWNTSNPKWKIEFVTRKNNNEKLFVIHMGGEKVWLPASKLIDSSGNVKHFSHPDLKPLVSFLETKYLNVVEADLNSDKKFKLPTSWVKNAIGEIEIGYQMYDNYNDFVLDNYLYTEVNKPSESDNLPTFVNQYATLGESVSDRPVTRKEKVTPIIKKPKDIFANVNFKLDNSKSPIIPNDTENLISDSDFGKAMLEAARAESQPVSNEEGINMLMAAKVQEKPNENEDEKQKCQTKSPFKSKQSKRGNKLI